MEKVDLSKEKSQAAALKERAGKAADTAEQVAKDNRAASTDADTAGFLFSVAETASANNTDADDDFVAPLIDRGRMLLSRGLNTSPEPTA